MGEEDKQKVLDVRLPEADNGGRLPSPETKMNHRRNQKGQNGLGGEGSRVFALCVTHRHLPSEAGREGLRFDEREKRERVKKKKQMRRKKINQRKYVYLYPLESGL